MKRCADAVEHGNDMDALFVLQHQPVYTLGASSTEANLRFDPSFPPLPLHRTERGGEVTYHGPGQVRSVSVSALSEGCSSTVESTACLVVLGFNSQNAACILDDTW